MVLGHGDCKGKMATNGYKFSQILNKNKIIIEKLGFSDYNSVFYKGMVAGIGRGAPQFPRGLLGAQIRLYCIMGTQKQNFWEAES